MDLDIWSLIQVPWVPEAFHPWFPILLSLKSDLHEKPLDKSAIPLIGRANYNPLIPIIRNLDVLLIGSLEMLNVSKAMIGFQSQ